MIERPSCFRVRASSSEPMMKAMSPTPKRDTKLRVRKSSSLKIRKAEIPSSTPMAT
jgi:hypothetical protein